MNGVPGGEKGSIFLSDWIIWEVGYFHLGMTRRNENPHLRIEMWGTQLCGDLAEVGHPPGPSAGGDESRKAVELRSMPNHRDKTAMNGAPGIE